MTVTDFKNITCELANLLKGSKFEGHVFAVGGSVRDLVMQSEIKDIDLVVDIPNGGIDLVLYLEGLGCLTHSPVTYPTYGTCMFSLKKFPDVELEAVHTRGEQYHDKNSRNPETFFAGIDADSIRRDLTINALYYDVFTGKIIDPTGKGMDDIRNHVIRTSNTNPNTVFDDDPLRILRVIRFSAKYGWEIERQTLEAMKLYADRLDIISRERITHEFVNMLMTSNPHLAMQTLFDLRLTGVVTGVEMHDCVRMGAVNDALLECVKDDRPLYTRLAVIYSDFGEKRVYDIMHRLKFSNTDAKNVSRLIGHLNDFDTDCSDKNIRLTQLKFRRARFHELMWTMQALGMKNADVVVRKTRTGVCDMFGYKLPLDGNDIIRELGIESGVMVGVILDEMLHVVCENPFFTRKELIEFYKNRHNGAC